MKKVIIKLADGSKTEAFYHNEDVKGLMQPFDVIKFNGEVYRHTFIENQLDGYSLTKLLEVKPKSDEEIRAEIIKELADIEEEEKGVADRKRLFTEKLEAIDSKQPKARGLGVIG